MRPQSLVYDVNRGVRRRASHVHDCTREREEPISLHWGCFGKAEDVPVEFPIFVFVMEHDDAVIPGGRSLITTVALRVATSMGA